jgi:hypothetical protein
VGVSSRRYDAPNHGAIGEARRMNCTCTSPCEDRRRCRSALNHRPSPPVSCHAFRRSKSPRSAADPTTFHGPTTPLNQTPWYVKSVVFKGRQLVDSPFDFGTSGAFTGIDVVLSALGATVTGRVTDDRAAPLSDYAVASPARTWLP